MSYKLKRPKKHGKASYLVKRDLFFIGNSVDDTGRIKYNRIKNDRIKSSLQPRYTGHT